MVGWELAHFSLPEDRVLTELNFPHKLMETFGVRLCPGSLSTDHRPFKKPLTCFYRILYSAAGCNSLLTVLYGNYIFLNIYQDNIFLIPIYLCRS